MSATKLKPGWIYPLIEADRYDDELGSGFGHVAIPSAGHDEPREGYYLSDAWIVDAHGNVHPGYDGSPIPIRADDVDLGAGKPINFDLPEPKSIFDAFANR